MATVPHRVRKVSWAVTTGSEGEAFSWRALVRTQGLDILSSALEEAFDEAAGESLYIRIPRIELSVRADSEEEFPDALYATTLAQLREKLAAVPDVPASGPAPHPGGAPSGGPQAIDSSGAASSPGFAAHGDGFSTRREPPPAVQGGRSVDKGHQPTDFEVAASRDALWDTLMHYLRTGFVPWEAAGGPGLRTEHMLREACTENWPRLMRHSAGAGPAWFYRLLQLLPDGRVSELTRTVARELPEETKLSLARFVRHLLTSGLPGIGRHIRLMLAAYILAGYRRDQGRVRISSLIEECVRNLPPDEAEAFTKLLPSLHTVFPGLFGTTWDRPATAPGDNENGRASAGSFAQGVMDEGRGGRAADAGTPASGPSGYAGGRSPGRDGETGIGQAVMSADIAAGETPAPWEQGPVMVEGAGLVLLHPFLPRLFENVGIRRGDDGSIVHSGLPRAAALLHFLATGREELFEYELVLVKVLLGLGPASFLPVSDGVLKKTDRDEADVVLKSAVAHWEALKGTSADGLRTAFLSRQGLLSEVEGGYRLKVERKPFDMLLDSLPWGIGLVKLPWMRKAVYTEW